MPEVDDDQLAAPPPAGTAFGFVQLIKAISHDPAAAPAKRSDESDARGGEPSAKGE